MNGNKILSDYRRSFIQYSLVGLSSLVIDYFILFLLLSLDYGLYFSVSISFFLSSIYNFIMNRKYTFRKNNKNIYKQLVRYTFLLLGSFFLTLLVFYFLSETFEVPLVKAISTVLIYFYGYFFSKLLVY